jgi:hypothetical protein
VLDRGHYPARVHQQHLELAAFYPRIAVAHTQIVTIATDNILEINEFREAVGAQWTFLSNAGRKVQRTAISGNTPTPPRPDDPAHTLVLRPGLVIHGVDNGSGDRHHPYQDVGHSQRGARPGSVEATP